MLHNDLFVELSDEQQELVAGGRGRKGKKGGSGLGGLNILQIGKSSFEQNYKGLTVGKTQHTAAGPHGAMTSQSDVVVLEKFNIHSDAFALDKIGGGKKRGY